MAKISGLFGFIDVQSRTGKIASKWRKINEDELGKSPAILLFLDIDKNPNPFVEVEGISWLEKKQYKAHLRIDRDFHSSNSEYTSRRNLSYCHATEYYTKDKQVYEVHHYFDSFGNYTHTLCKIIPEEGDGNSAMIETYNLSANQLDIMRIRASKYAGHILKFLQDKQQACSEINQQIVDKLEVLYNTLKKFTDRSVLKKMIDDIVELINLKSQYEDRGAIASQGLFMLQIEAIKQQLEEQDASKQEQQAKDEVGTEKNIEDNSVSADVQISSSIKSEQKRLKFSDVKKSCINKMDEIKKILGENKNIAKGDLLASEQIPNYIKLLHTTRLDLISVWFDMQLTKDNKKDIAKLWEKFESFPSEMMIFESAIANGNLAVVTNIFEFCRDKVTDKLYYDQIKIWLQESKPTDDETLSINKEKIFDFLSDNCETFNNFIIKSRQIYVYISGPATDKLSLIMIPYMFDNIRVFSALLRYGYDPCTPWVMNNTGLQSPLQTILYNPAPKASDFLSLLMEYGYSLTRKLPYEVGTIDGSADSLKSSHYRNNSALQRKVENLLTSQSKFGEEVGLESGGIQSISYKPEDEHKRKFCALLSFIKENPHYHEVKNFELFKLLAEKTDFVGLCISLAELITRASTLKLDMLATTPGIDLLTVGEELVEEEYPRNDDELFFNIRAEFTDENETSCANFILLKIVTSLNIDNVFNSMSQVIEASKEFNVLNSKYMNGLHIFAVEMLHALVTNYENNEQHRLFHTRMIFNIANDWLSDANKNEVSKFEELSVKFANLKGSNVSAVKTTTLEKSIIYNSYLKINYKYYQICMLYLQVLAAVCDPRNQFLVKEEFVKYCDINLRGILNQEPLMMSPFREHILKMALPLLKKFKALYADQDTNTKPRPVS